MPNSIPIPIPDILQLISDQTVSLTPDWDGPFVCGSGQIPKKARQNQKRPTVPPSSFFKKNSLIRSLNDIPCNLLFFSHNKTLSFSASIPSNSYHCPLADLYFRSVMTVIDQISKLKATLDKTITLCELRERHADNGAIQIKTSRFPQGSCCVVTLERHSNRATKLWIS